MPTLHGPFKVYGTGFDDALRQAHETARGKAPGSAGKVSTRVLEFGTAENGEGLVQAWIEFQVQVDD